MNFVVFCRFYAVEVLLKLFLKFLKIGLDLALVVFQLLIQIFCKAFVVHPIFYFQNCNLCLQISFEEPPVFYHPKQRLNFRSCDLFLLTDVHNLVDRNPFAILESQNARN